MNNPLISILGNLKGPYNGRAMVSFARQLTASPQSTYVTPSRTMMKDTTGKWPTIVVRTAKRCLVAKVLDRMYAEWFCSGDLLRVWKAGCEAADALNESLENDSEIPATCNCVNDMPLYTSHPCGGCLVLTPCNNLTVDDVSSIPLCRKCATTSDDPNDTGVEDKERGKSQLRSRVSTLIRKDLKNTLKGTKLKTTTANWLDTAWKEMFANTTDDDEWWDAYTSELSSFTEAVTVREKGIKSPILPSVDAIFPFALYDETVAVHCPGNLVSIPLCLNFLKHTFVPAVLQIAADFLNSTKTEQDREKIMEKMENVWLISLTSAYEKSTRMNQKFTADKHEGVKKEWVAGKPLFSTPAKSTQKYLRRKVVSPSENWRPAGVNRFLKVVSEIEVNFDVVFTRSGDGAPWPFHNSSMPEDWGWIAAWHLFVDRLHRLYFWCNRYWSVVDENHLFCSS